MLSRRSTRILILLTTTSRRSTRISALLRRSFTTVIATAIAMTSAIATETAAIATRIASLQTATTLR